ncbi:DUF5305 domain-containing protein [Natronosalvus vescus]|uniref:DUF5305 domain-containing protein n=1 Tax=Natronosalvus vescus TaxID=2953881 RepID=UPI002091B666|nr:DUF5305 domain-containing protein [Natronosalvus vescus]
MNGERAILRARSALDQWFVLVVVVLVALSAFGGWMAYSAYAADPAPDDERTVEVWSTTAGYHHSAEVQVDNPVFDVGDELSNQPVYYTRIAPELEGEFRHRYDGTDGVVTLDVELERVVRSVDGDAGEYWSVSESLGSSTVDDLEAGETHTTAFTLDVPGLANETDEIDSSLGSTPGTTETVVVAYVTLEGTVDGESVNQTNRYELVVDPDGDTYTVEGPENDRYAEERTEAVESDAAAGAGFDLGESLGGLVLLVLSLSALGATTVAKRRGALTPSAADLERARARHEREQFDDWITRGVLPDAVLDRPRVDVDTLEGLVDVAIDCEKRVIEEQTEDGPSYWVLDGGLLYVYEPVEPVLEGSEDVRPGDDGDAPPEEPVVEGVEVDGLEEGDGTISSGND